LDTLKLYNVAIIIPRFDIFSHTPQCGSYFSVKNTSTILINAMASAIYIIGLLGRSEHWFTPA